VEITGEPPLREAVPEWGTAPLLEAAWELSLFSAGALGPDGMEADMQDPFVSGYPET